MVVTRRHNMHMHRTMYLGHRKNCSNPTHRRLIICQTKSQHFSTKLNFSSVEERSRKFRSYFSSVSNLSRRKMGDSEDTKAEQKGEESKGGENETRENVGKVKTEESKEGDKNDSKPEPIERQKPNVTSEIAKDAPENNEENKTETIMSSQSLKSSNPSISIPNDHATGPSVSTSLKNVKERYLNRNQSDILPSLREIPRDEDPSLMIFSNKGQPTKKYFRRREVNSTILPFGFNEKQGLRLVPSPRIKVEAELTPKISQTVPKNTKLGEDSTKKPLTDKNPNILNPSVSRNVLTGFGVGSQNEFKSKSMRRKDGNPVLGEGYEEPVVATNIGRVPPGGFSSGLW